MKPVFGQIVVSALASATVLLSGCSQPAPDPHEQLVQSLLKQFDAIPFVDSHVHIPLPGDIQARFSDSFRYDVKYAIGGATYVAQFITGKDWKELSERIQVNAHHAYYRPMVLAMRDLYGLGDQDEIDERSAGFLSTRMDSMHRTQRWYGEVLKRANVERILWMDWDGEDRHRLDSNRVEGVSVHPVWNVDWKLVYISGAAEGSGFKLDRVESWAGRKIRNLKDMEDVIRSSIGDFFRNGGAGLKTTSAYFRTLDFNLDVQRARQVDFIHVIAQVCCLFRTHQPVAALHFGQRHPDLPPEQALVVFRPQAAHFG
jgi:hypothetical protein